MDSIVLHQHRVKPVLNYHPWIFSGAVKKFPESNSGEIVEVKSESGVLLGYGFSDPGSQISCRMFHFGPKEIAGFGQDYWNEKFQKAMLLRKSILVNGKTDTYRLIHAEGDNLPGIIADVYGGQTVSINTLIPASKSLIETWKRALQNLGFTSVYHRKDQDKAGAWILGEGSPEGILSTEHGLQFWVDVEHGQKTGFFIDQRENRKIIGEMSLNRHVLNAFGYTGGFSVYALQGGAASVVTVDISDNACQQAIRNIKTNQFEDNRHTAVKADCFEYLKEMEAVFDVIVLDPPAFAKSRSAVDKAARGYKEINLSAFRKIKPGGILATFSCSQHIDKDLFRKIVFGAASDSGRAVRIIRQLVQPPDHPINIYHPEGEYLKGLLLYVE